MSAFPPKIPFRAQPIRPMNWVPPFKKGNIAAARVNMTVESDKKRMSGLFKAWDRRVITQELKKQGKRPMTIRKRKRIRKRIRMTVAKEAKEIQNIARMHATEAMARMAEIVNDRTAMDSVAIAAAQVIFDRAYGKAPNTNINANVNGNDKPSEASAKQLDERITGALKRVEELTGGTPKASKGQKRPIDVRKLDRDPNSSTQH